MFPELTIVGAPYERGCQYGAAVPRLIDHSIASYSRLFAYRRGLDWSESQEAALAFLPVLREVAPDLLEEMRGILLRGELDAAPLMDIATATAARILRVPGRGSLSPGDHADLVVVRDGRGEGPRTPAGLRRSDLRAVVRDGAPCIADPDFAEWFALAGVEAVPAMLDGTPKLLARWLAVPEVVALEPGLELLADASVPDRAPALMAGSR